MLITERTSPELLKRDHPLSIGMILPLSKVSDGVTAFASTPRHKTSNQIGDQLVHVVRPKTEHGFLLFYIKHNNLDRLKGSPDFRDDQSEQSFLACIDTHSQDIAILGALV